MTEPRLTLPTKCAHWGWHDHRYFGHAVFDELTGHESMAGLSALSILGRRLPKECCDVLDDIACASTLADPRIWPLKITRLVASFGSVMPAVAAGLAIQQDSRIGPWKATDAALILQELHPNVAGQYDNAARVRDALDACFTNHDIIAGFGTPYRSEDERLVALRACMRRRHRDHLPYWRLLLAIIEGIQPLRRPAPNVVLGIAAAMLDMDISANEIGPLTTVLFQHMFIAQGIEGSNGAHPELGELPETHISYVGVEARVSPRADVRSSTLRPMSAAGNEASGSNQVLLAF